MSAHRRPSTPRHRGPESADSAAGSSGLCAACGGDRLTEIAMTLTDGSPVRFRSCRKCEAKSWEQGGDDLSLTSVMDKARKPGT
jgi:hypothetical protein